MNRTLPLRYLHRASFIRSERGSLKMWQKKNMEFLECQCRGSDKIGDHVIVSTYVGRNKLYILEPIQLLGHSMLQSKVIHPRPFTVP